MLFDKGATGGSASMIPDSTAPPKQKSMELNQQAKGLTLETSRAPAPGQRGIDQVEIGFVLMTQICRPSKSGYKKTGQFDTLALSLSDAHVSQSLVLNDY